MKQVAIAASILLLFSALAESVEASVDLHMHLTIEVPLKGVYSGKLLNKAAVKNEKSRFRSRIDHESLEQSGLRLVVAALVANPLWGDPIAQLKEQIKLLNEFCELHPNWKIASEPDEAATEIAKGKKVFLLSLEGAWPLVDIEQFRTFLNKYPIRFVGPFHFGDLDSAVGKTADQRGIIGIQQMIYRWLNKEPEEPVSPTGKEMLKLLFKERVWVDISHASAGAIDYFLKVRPKGYPLLVSHTVLAKYYGTDRGISESLLTQVKTDGGAVGLLPSTELLEGTPAEKGTCPGQAEYLAQWNEIKKQIGSEKLFLGSDLNSPIPTIPPRPEDKPCRDSILPNGLVTAKDLKGITALEDKNAVENFLKTWKRVRN